MFSLIWREKYYLCIKISLRLGQTVLYSSEIVLEKIENVLKKSCISTHKNLSGYRDQNECRFSYGQYFTEKTIIAKPLDSKFSYDKNQEALTWRNTLLRQVKSYIDNNLNPVRVKVIDPTKDNFTQPLSVKEILDELGISKDDYNRALSISKDEDVELHLKTEPNSFFVNTNFDVTL